MSRADETVNRECETESAIGVGSGELLGGCSFLISQTQLSC
jgi:hypothetical protein